MPGIRLTAKYPAASVYSTRRKEQGAQFRSQVHDKLQGPAHTQRKAEKFDLVTLSPLWILKPIIYPPRLLLEPTMGDIVEGNEEEETEHESTTSPIEAATATIAGPISADMTEDMNFISPSQIQGLHTSTSLVPPSSSFATPPILLPILPLPPYPSVGKNNSTVNSATHPRISPPLACIVRLTCTHDVLLHQTLSRVRIHW